MMPAIKLWVLVSSHLSNTRRPPPTRSAALARVAGAEGAAVVRASRERCLHTRLQALLITRPCQVTMLDAATGRREMLVHHPRTPRLCLWQSSASSRGLRDTRRRRASRQGSPGWSRDCPRQGGASQAPALRRRDGMTRARPCWRPLCGQIALIRRAASAGRLPSENRPRLTHAGALCPTPQCRAAPPSGDGEVQQAARTSCCRPALSTSWPDSLAR